MRSKVLILAIGVLVALGAWAGVGASASAGHAQHSNPGTSTVRNVVHKQTHTTTVDMAKTKVTTKAQRTAKATENGTSATESEGATQSESGTESGSGTESDTHEDPAGQNVDHQCPPDCDMANGEQP